MGNALFLFVLQVGGQIKQAGDLLRCEIQEFEKPVFLQMKHANASKFMQRCVDYIGVPGAGQVSFLFIRT